MKTNNFFLLLEQPNLSGFFLVFLAILVLLSIVGIFYLFINSKTKERLALIEKGMDPNLAGSDFLTQILIIGGGFAIGLMIDDKLSVGYGPLTGIILAAIALVIFMLYKRKRARKDFTKRSTD
jgi:predicted MFS family arabinose efflux permease